MAALLMSFVPAVWHSDGALSRRQPGDAKHGSGPIVGSANVSQRTAVSSTPQLPAPLLCFRPCAPGSPFVTVRLKWPLQDAPFWSQNAIPAGLVVPGAEYSCSAGGFSSLERRLPVASDS